MTLSRWSRICASAGLVGVFAATGLTVPAGPAAAVGLKPQLRGVADRKGIPPSDYASVVNSFVVQVNWADLQTTPTAEITDTAPLDDTAGNKIDEAIGYARARGDGVGIKIRVYAGINAPEWAKSLPVTSGTPGPFQICDNSGTSLACGTVGHFWEQNYRTAYADFQALLAAKYDGEPEIRDVAITGCSIVYAEPLQRHGSLSSNRQAYKTAGYNEADNDACEHDQITAHQVWNQTSSSLALNVYQRWDDTTARFTNDESYTEAMADFCRQTLGNSCVLGNNGIGKDGALYPCADIGGADWAMRDPENRMFTKISCAGAPIYFQTASAPKIQSYGFTLDDVLAWAVVAGAGLVELPVGYSEPAKWIYLSPSGLSCYDQEFEGGAKCLDTPPTAPMDVTAIAGTPPASAVDLSWSASTDDYGVRGYQIWRDGNPVGSTAATTRTFTDTGLRAGTTYAYTVYATDKVPQQLSPPSDPVTITTAVASATAPGAPTGVGATSGDASATVTWTPPADNGGTAITGYTVTAAPGSATAAVGGSATSATVTGLANGTSYTFTVRATNAAGDSPSSDPSAAVTPATVPGAPTNVAATSGNASATVTWTPPADDGGSPITGYRVTASAGSVDVRVGATATSVTVTGLANGTSYTFTVRATNAVGDGTPSTPSNAVTPSAPPSGNYPVGVSDSGYAPKWLLLPGPGYTVAWNFSSANTRSHAVTDSSGMGLFNSGLRSPGSTYSFLFRAAGNYAYKSTAPEPTPLTGAVNVPVKISPLTGSTTTAYTVTWATAAPGPGFFSDVQYQYKPCATTVTCTWTSWTAWKTNQTTALNAAFSATRGAGTYQFRAHLGKQVNSTTKRFSGWSALAALSVS